MTFKAFKLSQFELSDFFHNFAPKFGFDRKCGEIWLLATTLKNAKIHAPVRVMPDPSASMFLCFLAAPHEVGLFCYAYLRAPSTVLQEKCDRYNCETNKH